MDADSITETDCYDILNPDPEYHTQYRLKHPEPIFHMSTAYSLEVQQEMHRQGWYSVVEVEPGYIQCTFHKRYHLLINKIGRIWTFGPEDSSAFPYPPSELDSLNGLHYQVWCSIGRPIL